MFSRTVGINFKTRPAFNNFKLLKRFTSSTAKHAVPPKPAKGIKKLMQEYGYSALGVYLGLSLIDLPICYLVVHSAGEDKIREIQEQVLEYVGYKSKNDDDKNITAGESTEPVEEKKSSTFLTEFALAYAIHKSLVFIRLPITAAITPWVVTKLRLWGFNVGKLASATAKTVGQEGLKGTLTKDGVKKVGEKMAFDPTGKSGKFGREATKGEKLFF